MILISFYNFFLNVIYFFLKLFPTKNKILFLSRQSDGESIDFKILIDKIQKVNKNIKIVVITRRVEKNFRDLLSKEFLLIFKKMYHLATSKVCILDGYQIPISVLKHKKSLKIIQIWHALGAIKCFGYQSLNTNKKRLVAKYMKMHKNYDLIISGSSNMTPYFAKAFNYSEDKFINIGLPRVDYLIKQSKSNKDKILKKYPNFKNKKVILYVPTFRENDNYQAEKLIESVDTDKYIFIIKSHPVTKNKVHTKKEIYTCPEFKSIQLLSIADYVVTDYSAISLEASLLNLPIFIYAYDFDEYKKYPGLNIDLKKEFGKYVYKNAKELYKELNLNNYNLDIVKKFKEKYIDITDGTITDRIVKVILQNFK